MYVVRRQVLTCFVLSLLVALTQSTHPIHVGGPPPSDPSPVSSSSSLKYYFHEEQPPGSFVGNLIVDARLDSRFSTSALDRKRFHILRQVDSSLNVVRLFRVNETSGDLTTVVQVDRETLCPSSRRAGINCLVYVEVAVLPADSFHVVRLVIDILDINDNQPYFSVDADSAENDESPEVVFFVPETVSPGHIILLPPARDADSRLNGVERYRLEPASTAFRLQLETGD